MSKANERYKLIIMEHGVPTEVPISVKEGVSILGVVANNIEMTATSDKQVAITTMLGIMKVFPKAANMITVGEF